MPQPDPKLREFATDRQWEMICAFAEHGGASAAARALDADSSNVARAVRIVETRAARAGYAPAQGLTAGVPAGQRLRGVSTLYGPDGTVRGQWVKSAEDQEQTAAFLAELRETFTEDLPRLAPVAAPTLSLGHLLAVYPIGDHHMGMYSWDEETGADYDLGIAEARLSGAMQSLATSTPSAAQALVAILGDFFHYDNLQPVTPTNKNPLDADSRYAKLVRVALRSIRRAIDLALARHATVRVICEPGNHDLSTMLLLAEALAALYETEPRITVDTAPRHFHYHHFGANLIGVHHGHSVKPPDLPLVMARDVPAEWGASRHRWWLTGHVHKDRVLDIQGVRVESFRVLAPLDAWGANQGYRPEQRMVSVVLHEAHGEVARYAVTPEMLA